MNRLKELRKEKGLTQKAFSKEINIPLRTLQNWENGESNIKPEKAETLAGYFGVPVEYLLGYNVPRYTKEQEASVLGFHYLNNINTPHYENEFVTRQIGEENLAAFIDFLRTNLGFIYDTTDNQTIAMNADIDEGINDFIMSIPNLPEEMQALVTHWALIPQKQRDTLLEHIKSFKNNKD
ncbi:helix-turn-helix domain-containing protein [Streptococcus sp. FT1-106]|uniref:helix-turn-helix domain-containing protein n=1 Tax=Streptococcus sp. FT1-106 TaxID=3409994 RepID=UPI003BF542A2